MTNIEIAKWVTEAFRRLTNETRLWAKSGDNDAALDLIRQMTAENQILKSLGHALDDEGNLVKHHSLTNKDQKKAQLALAAARGDTEAANELMEVIAQGVPDE